MCLVTQSCPTLCDPKDCSSSVHMDSPDKNTGMGCHIFLQGIFPTQVLNPGLPHCVQTLYCLSAQGKHGGREQTSKRTRSAYSSDELISFFSWYNLGEKKTLNNHPPDEIII